MSEANGKDPTNGRFTAGNTWGGKSPGNPVARRMSSLRRSVVEAVTEDQVRAAMDRLYELGMAGDVPAIKTWLELVLGKPVQAVEVTAADPAAGDLINAIGDALVQALGGDQDARIKAAEVFRRMAEAPSNN